MARNQCRFVIGAGHLTFEEGIGNLVWVRIFSQIPGDRFFSRGPPLIRVQLLTFTPRDLQLTLQLTFTLHSSNCLIDSYRFLRE